MARATEPSRPGRPRDSRLAWLGPWLLANLSVAQAGNAEGAVTGTTPAVTLRQLVDAARLNKAAELAIATTRLAGLPRASADAMAPTAFAGDASDGLPRLWSLTAAGDRWRAEVLLEGRVHAVDAAAGPGLRVGPWRVVGLTGAGLDVERIAARGRPPLRLVLSPPARGTAAAGYRFERLWVPADDRVERPGGGAGDGGHRDHVDHVDRRDHGDHADVGDPGAVHRAAALPAPVVPAPSRVAAP